MNHTAPEKPKLRYPVVVEGKYDKIKLDSLFTGQIFTAEGFGIFKNAEKTALFRKIAEKTPLIVATDPDGGGKVIRGYFSSILPPERVYHVYMPQRRGKEARKQTASKEGYLGVEGMDADTLRQIFAPYILTEGVDSPCDSLSLPSPSPLTSAVLYSLGLTGTPGAAERRKRLCIAAGLPADLTTPALQRALPLLYSMDELEALIAGLAE